MSEKMLSRDTVMSAARAWLAAREKDPQTIGVGVNKSGAAVIHSLLALLEDESAEAERKPVAWRVEHRPHLNPGYVELWTRKERADQQAESIRAGYPDDVVTVTPLFTSPTPTQATALTSQEEDANG